MPPSGKALIKIPGGDLERWGLAKSLSEIKRSQVLQTHLKLKMVFKGNLDSMSIITSAESLVTMVFGTFSFVSSMDT
jgi:hypothetical protein